VGKSERRNAVHRGWQKVTNFSWQQQIPTRVGAVDYVGADLCSAPANLKRVPRLPHLSAEAAS
jgi:hypothetical protein